VHTHPLGHGDTREEAFDGLVERWCDWLVEARLTAIKS